jgi:rubrerythrin
MEPSALFKLITSLEDDLARFYAKLKNISSLNEFVKVFEKMEQQSRGHSNKIQKDAFSFEVKPLDCQPIYELHNKIKKTLFDKVTTQNDTESALKILADSEEVIGKLYQSIANHYKKQATHYTKLIETLEEISKDEFKHRDAILKSFSKISK